MTPSNRSVRLQQQGFVSILVVLAIILVVAVILKQSVQISASKSLSGLQQSDSVAALAQAQNGTEIALKKFSTAFSASADMTTACANSNLGLTAENTALNGTGPQNFSLVAAKAASSNGISYCKILVTGVLRGASRTIETWVKAKVTYGTVGFGTTFSLQLTNPWTTVPSIGVFNSGWGVSSSAGHDVSGTGNVDCSNCQTPTDGTTQLWYAILNGTGNDIGGAGNWKAMGAGLSDSYSHTLTTSNPGKNASRNYVMVGHVLGGVDAASPNILGKLGVSNNSSSGTGSSTSTTVDKVVNWCNDPPSNAPKNANAIVIGVTARGAGLDANNRPVGSFTSVNFNYDASAGNGITVNATSGPSKTYVHYPDATVNDGLNPVIAQGDVFAELYYFYQDPVIITVVSSSAKDKLTLSNANPSSLVNRYLRPGSYSPGTVDDDTYLKSYDSVKNEFTLNRPYTGSNLNNAQICTGICGFYPSKSNTRMNFTFKNTSGIVGKAWVAGVTCLKGVDDSKVQPVTSSSGITVMQWHEVLSNDPTF